MPRNSQHHHRDDFPRFSSNRMLQLAIENAIIIRGLLEIHPRFGDSHDQISRACESVVRNLGEAIGAIHLKVKKSTAGLARGENTELAGSLWCLLRGKDHPIHDRVDHLGRMLTRFIANARPGWTG